MNWLYMGGERFLEHEIVVSNGRSYAYYEGIRAKHVTDIHYFTQTSNSDGVFLNQSGTGEWNLEHLRPGLTLGTEQ